MRSVLELNFSRNMAVFVAIALLRKDLCVAGVGGSYSVYPGEYFRVSNGQRNPLRQDARLDHKKVVFNYYCHAACF